MVRFVALLRAVNLGGGTQLSMAELGERMRAEGYRDVRTLLQSGNVVFSSDRASAATIERHLDAALRPRLGPTTEFFVRTEEEWGRLRAANPFPREAKADPGHLLLMVLKAPPSPARWKDLAASIVGRERVRGKGREAYIVYPDGVGRSKLTAARIERALGTTMTSRNWNTVGRIAEALADRSSA